MSKDKEKAAESVDPVRTNPDNTQNEGEAATNADELKGAQVPEEFKPPETAAKNIGLKVAVSPESHDKMREMASMIATDKDHPLHSLGAGLPFAQAVLNILSILRGVLNTLHDNGIIEKS